MKAMKSDGVRVAMAAGLAVLELSTMAALLIFLGTRAAPVYAVIQALSGTALLCLMGGREDGAYRTIWMGCTLVLGPAGVLLFLLLGRQNGSRIARLTAENMHRAQQLLLGQGCEPKLTDELPVRYLCARGFPLYAAGTCRYFPTGEAFLSALLEDIAQAQMRVELEFFLISPGKIFDDLLKICSQAHERGVFIRLLIDDTGTLFYKDKRLRSRIAQSGVELRVFNPIAQPAALFTLNFRDHRKIAVIDGRIAYTGGVNVADEYANLFAKHGFWKDTGIRIEGESAVGFEAFFYALWAAAGNEPLSLPTDRTLPGLSASGWAQPYQSGPMGSERSCAAALLRLMIASAHRRVWLATPYLLLDEPLESALCLAAQCGLDVRIILPGIPDHRAVELAGESHYPALLRSGVRLYRYAPGFVHAKLCLCDDALANVGTINLDFRSMYLHFEDGVLLRDVPSVQDIRRDMEDMMNQSELVDLEAIEHAPLPDRIARAVLRVLSPLL